MLHNVVFFLCSTLHFESEFLAKNIIESDFTSSVRHIQPISFVRFCITFCIMPTMLQKVAQTQKVEQAKLLSANYVAKG